jgi:tRNA threonylcarbamoyladenosine biosynthesis protein TsaE
MLDSSSINAKSMELTNQEASEQFARRLASCLTTPLVIGFCGDIGTGKTTIIRAMLQQLGIQSAIKSPTFSLVESYQLSDSIALHHFDLYRIHHEDELEYLGFRDYFSPSTICCIEWAEKAGKALPYMDIRFTLKIKGAGREALIETMTSAGNHILTCLVGDS